MNPPRKSSFLFKRARVFDGARFLKGKKDVLIVEGRVERIASRFELHEAPTNAKVIDARNLWLCPGFIDLHCHLREPGEGRKERVETGLLSAAKGGFTLVVSMPNTKPPCDSVRVFKLQLDLREKAIKTLGKPLPQLIPACALTKGRHGKEPVNFPPLVKAGCKIFTDDGSDVEDEFVLREIFLRLAKLTGIRKMFHAEAYGLSRGGIVHLGPVSKKLRVQGNTRLSEDVAVARALVFAEAFKVPIHITHLSSYRSVELIRRAKKVFNSLGMGGQITCDVTPHHLALTVDVVPKLGALAKVNPPLREEKDRALLVAGLLDGTIDCIATDHAPHTKEEKTQPLDTAPFGICGFESAFPVAMRACEAWGSKKRTERILASLTSKPAQVLNLPDQGRVLEGSLANLTLIAPRYEWTVRGDTFASKCKFTPFDGTKVRGKPVATFVNGEIAFADCEKLNCHDCQVFEGVGCST